MPSAFAPQIIAVELTEENLKQSFSAIHLLVARELGLQAGETCSDRQRTLQTTLEGTTEESSYCLLNDVFLAEVRVRGCPAGMLCCERLSSGLGFAGLVPHLSDSCAQESSCAWGAPVPCMCPVSCSAPWKWH